MGFLLISLLILLAILAGISWLISAWENKRSIDLELAKHGLTRKSANAGTAPRRQAKSSKSSTKTTMKPASSGIIHNITNPKGAEYKIYGAGNNMLCTVRAKGNLVGWGDDFFLMDDNGRITTYNYEGDSIGSVKYNPNKEYIGSIRKKGFTIVSAKNSKNKKLYDSNCDRNWDI